MNNEAGQSEELNPQGQGQQGSEVEKNGANEMDGGANAGNDQEHEGDKGDQGQSKSQNRKQRLRRLNEELTANNAQLAEDNRKQAERLATLEQKVDGVLNPPKPRPDRVNFESENEYEDELNRWFQEESTKRQNAESNNNADKGSQNGAEGDQGHQKPAGRPPLPQKVVDSWIDRCDDAADKYEDFDEALNDKSIPITGAMADTMMEAPGGAETAYYFSKNKGEADRISKLSIPQQVLETQKLTSKFAPSITNAPDPITVPAGGGDEGNGLDPEKMSPEQYRQWRRKTKAARN